MRQQTQKMQELLKEYKELKNRIFGNFTFVTWDDKDKDMQRYNQLFQFFYPNYRTKNFINPLS